MITTAQRKIIKQLIGKNHIKKITAFLEEKGIRTRENTFYSTRHVSNVWSGRYENEIIEKGIWEYVEILTEEKEKENAEKETILDKVKNLTNATI